MLDGIKLSCKLPNLARWMAATGIDLHVSTNTDTGAIKERISATGKTITYRGAFGLYKITVKEVHNNEGVLYWLNIEGSLHKNYYKGENYSPFTWDELQAEIKHLCASLDLDPTKTKIDNLEFGVNVEVPFKPFDYLSKNLILYKGYRFSQYKPDNGKCIGYVCEKPAQYKVKVYDKGLQYNLPYNLMRFELRFIKMQRLNRLGIFCLKDLMQYENVVSLIDLLLLAWDSTLTNDKTIQLECLSIKNKEKMLLIEGGNERYWEALDNTDKRQFNYKRQLFRSLINEHGAGHHINIKNKIKKKWASLSLNTSFNKLPIMSSLIC